MFENWRPGDGVGNQEWQSSKVGVCLSLQCLFSPGWPRILCATKCEDPLITRVAGRNITPVYATAYSSQGQLDAR